MKTKQTWLVAVMIVLIGAGVQVTAWAGDYTEHFEQIYDIAPDGVVSLDNVNGDVTVEVWDQNQVWVRAEKSASTAELLEHLKVKVEATGSEVLIDTVYPDRWVGNREERRHMEVSYTVTVPRTAAIDDFDLVNGDLLIRGLEGPIRAECVNGAITVDGFGRELELDNVNGHIEVFCRTVDPSARISLDSVNGEVEVHLAPSVAATIEVETVNGRISNDFGLDVRKHKYVGANLSGELGGGGAKLSVETVNGSVSILRD